MKNGLETNKTELRGTIINAPEYSHKTYGETFYNFVLGIERKSGYVDEIPIVISERLIWNYTLKPGDRVHIFGQIRTYNETVDGKNRLIIVVFTREFELAEDPALPDENKVYLDGFICKPPVRRVSPLGRDLRYYACS